MGEFGRHRRIPASVTIGYNQDGITANEAANVSWTFSLISQSHANIHSAFVLVGYILLVTISYTSSYIVSIVLQGLAPLCSMPLISMMPVCANLQKSQAYVQEPRYPDLVNLQTRFESVMESTGYGINLALDMKNSEMAVRDLNTLVSQ